MSNDAAIGAYREVKTQSLTDLRADTAEGWEDVNAGWVDAAFSIGLDSSPFIRGLRGQDAVGLSLAIQCADVKARDVAKAPMSVWRHKGQKRSILEPNQHWLARLLSRRPNDSMTWGEFWRMVVVHLELVQNAYILKITRRDGTIEELLPLMPARVRPLVYGDELFYQINASTQWEIGQLGAAQVVVPASRIIHLRGRMWDGLMGLSNQVLGHPTFVLLKAINDYQTHLFASDGKPPMAFVTKESFQGDQSEHAFRRLKDQITQRYRSMLSTGAPLLLENGIEPKPLGINADDALTADTYNAQVLRVCGIMHVPPHKIFALESVKYDNSAHMDDQYAQDCVIPLACNIEEKFRNDLLDDEELDFLWPEFDRETILAGDRVSMSQRIDMAIKNGLMTINEGRMRLSLNPITGGDVRTIPTSMAVYDEQGRLTSQAAQGQPNNGAAPADPNATQQDAGAKLHVIAGGK